MRIDPEVMEGALRRLLEGDPDAIVGAVNREGLYVPVPDGFPVEGHRIAQARSALDLIAPESRTSVISAWERGRTEGASSVAVKLAVDRDESRPGTLFLFDLTGRFGVHVAVLTATRAAAEDLAEVAEITAPPPRLVRTRKNELAVLTEVEPEITEMLGWEPSDLIGRRTLDFAHPDDHDLVINAWMEVLEQPGVAIWSRFRHQHRDGHWVWLQVSNRNLLGGPEGGHVACEMLDISQEMEAHEAVRASEQLLRRLAEALPVGVVHFDASRRLLYANERFSEILGAAPDDVDSAVRGCFVDFDRLSSAIRAVLSGADIDVELQVERADGSGRRQCTLSLRALTTPEGNISGAVGSLTDVTDAARMQAELERRATVDDLTGCANRATTLTMLAAALEGPAPAAAVIFADLDGFKEINDRYGHVTGDLLLMAVAARLRDAVRAGDLVGRVGGDEFLVICPNAADPGVALALADRIASLVAEPLQIDGQLLHIRASVGLACADGPVTPEDLIARADEAMYDSKRSGQGRAVLAAAAGTGPAVVPTRDLRPAGTG